jgi:threonine/homoserine/homoserine lactone efflux protein
VQPGPFQAYLISQSLANGWRKTVPIVFAPLMSDGPIILLVLLVLTNMPREILHMLQVAGGILCLYLAFDAFDNWRKFDQKGTQPVHIQQNIFKGVTVNLLNPAPYLGWSLIMGPLLLKGWHEHPMNGIALILGFYGTMILCSIGMVILFAAARHLGPRVIKASIAISVFALAGFGVYQFWSGIIAW